MNHLFYLIAFCFVGAVFGQNDSLYTQNIDHLNQKGNQYYFKQKDSAYFYFERAHQLASLQDDFSNAAQSLITISDIAGYHNDLKKVKSSIEQLDSLLIVDAQKLSDPTEKLYLNNSLRFGKGMYHYLIDDFKKSRAQFFALKDEINQQPDSLLTDGILDLDTSANSYISKMYLMENKYDVAEQHYRNTIHTIGLKKPVNQRLLHGNYSLLAQVLRRQKKYKESNTYLLKALKFNQKNSKNTNRLISGAQVIASNHLDEGQLDSTAFYLYMMKGLLSDSHPASYRYHKLNAEFEKTKNNYETARESANSSIDLLEKKWGKTSHEQLTSAYIQLADIHAHFNEPKAALQVLNTAIQKFDLNKGNKSSLLKLLKNKSKALVRLDTKKTYKDAIHTVNEATATFNFLKPTYRSQVDKLLLVEDAFPIFESGIAAAYQLYQSNQKDSLINQAFNFAEKSKSILLLEALFSSKANQFANIPHALLEQEHQLKSEITFLEKKINRAKTTDKQTENELFKLKQAQRDFLERIETNYPAYYNLKYNTQISSLTATQKLLKKNETLITYFYGSKAIYAIGITKNSKRLERISLSPEFKNKINSVREMLGNPQSDVATLAAESFDLYQHLVAPFTATQVKQELIIIPDGLLNYIPFGALNTQENRVTYLTKTHSVSYTNSATLYAELLERKSKKGGLLAFAPSFSGEQAQIDVNRSKLLPLPNNTREVKQLLQSFKGTSYLNKQASLSNFKKEISSHSILHLATHAVFDDTAPEYSYLAFSESEGEDLLYVSDLYNLEINADLVTLSACETGLGKLRRGEGFMSLARGFFYSGASSIASTLWKVNDASSTDLMHSFYQNLAAGEPKNLALQKAQKTFLETNRQNGLAHPYYWSGYIISGNTTPLVTPNYLIWLAVATLISIGIWFLLLRKRKATSQSL